MVLIWGFRCGAPEILSATVSWRRPTLPPPPFRTFGLPMGGFYPLRPGGPPRWVNRAGKPSAELRREGMATPPPVGTEGASAPPVPTPSPFQKFTPEAGEPSISPSRRRLGRFRRVYSGCRRKGFGLHSFVLRSPSGEGESEGSPRGAKGRRVGLNSLSLATTDEISVDLFYPALLRWFNSCHCEQSRDGISSLGDGVPLENSFSLCLRPLRVESKVSLNPE